MTLNILGFSKNQNVANEEYQCENIRDTVKNYADFLQKEFTNDKYKDVDKLVVKVLDKKSSTLSEPSDENEIVFNMVLWRDPESKALFRIEDELMGVTHYGYNMARIQAHQNNGIIKPDSGLIL